MHPSKFWNLICFLALPVTPGSLRRVLEPPKSGLFWSQTKNKSVGRQCNHLDTPIKIFDFFCIFGPTSHPRTPPKGPETPQKLSLLESNQKQCCGASMELCPSNFLIFLAFSAFLAQPVTPGPLQRVLETPKAVISGVEPKTRLWGPNVIVSMGPSKFLIFLFFGPSSHPRNPPKGPGTPQKRSFLESN